MHIVLHQPEIPQNTGNIGRTCVATGSELHLIEPLGFRLTERELKRSGMDYWERLKVTRYINTEDFYDRFGQRYSGTAAPRIWLCTTKAEHAYHEVSYGPDDWLMFGSEGSGLPEELLVAHRADCIRIPMESESRSLNLSNSVAIVLYEALRQNGFPGMKKAGELHRLSWE
ncbi:MAG: tRNA (cytidine(34)-2'-O)-methyltransferase [Lachnospiraceae bacterium]|nr:tRNA (cytidine(34)-2'-O)-methyltransferase [Lachnospiraceae bacterium]